jgi:hypothetical protein
MESYDWKDGHGCSAGAGAGGCRSVQVIGVERGGDVWVFVWYLAVRVGGVKVCERERGGKVGYKRILLY